MSYFRTLLVPALAVLAVGAGCTPAGPLPSSGAPEPRVETAPERGLVHLPKSDAPAETTVLGVIVSQSGDRFLERFSAQVLDGIKLAVEAHTRAGGAPVELVVLDDGGDESRVGALVRELEDRGAAAIVGPLRPEGVNAAAAARQDSLLLLISPTAPDLPPGNHIYSLNSVDTRGAELLASYALATGLRRVGLLYSEAPEYRRQAEVFRAALVRGGGSIVAEAAYPVGTTTFAAQLQQVAGAMPEAVFIPASERDVRQIAPQITYYGLADTGAQILGGEGWGGDDVLHEVAARYLEGVVATTALYRPSPEFGWTDFVSLYEESYRHSLESILPALGFDAVNLVLRTLDGRHTTPEKVTPRFEYADEHRGATGWISVRDGGVARRPVLVRIEAGKLVLLPAAGDYPGKIH